VTGNIKQYVGISRDTSASMTSLRSRAVKDYNSQIDALKNATSRSGVDTIVNVVKCGVGHRGLVVRDVRNASVHVLKSLDYNAYVTDGGSTPLFDSVGDLIEQLKAVPDYDDPNVSFLVMSTTDGEENSSRKWRYNLADEIRRLQASDRWTFVFRVPRGYRSRLISLGIPQGNILEWDQTDQGMKISTQHTEDAIEQYYTMRNSGVKSTNTFYTDLSTVSREEIKSTMQNITKEASVYPNTVRDGITIKELATHYTGGYIKGTVFYRLMKRESHVQDYKIICIRHRQSRAIYSGRSARNILGIPQVGDIALTPKNHGDYEIFIQSVSTTRKIKLNSSILIWQGAHQ
jgi:hypothetical protein